MNLYDLLTDQEKAYHDALVSIRERFGPMDVESSSIWVGYEEPDQNEESDIGVKCGNCAFHYDLNDGSQNLGCKLISFNVQENGNRTPINYVIPPGVDREQLYNNNSVINQNEQSLSLRVYKKDG